MNKNIFISYNHSGKTRKVAKLIAERLKNMGLGVWLDQIEILPGDSITESIKQNLEKSSFVIALITPKDKQSNWAKMELELAVKQGKRIIPVLVENAQTTDLPESIADRLAVDISDNFENLEAIYNTIDLQRSPWERLKEYLVNA